MSASAQYLCDPQDCTGCLACVGACSVGAVSIKVDAEGFWYPEIDAAHCVDCGACSRACPIVTPPQQDAFEKVVYAAHSINAEVRRESSSGGFFSELAKVFLEADGVVFGAAFNDDFELCHTYVERFEDLSRLRGSKYIQSWIGDSFLDVLRFLKDGRRVLFTGTPCQCAGLRRFLKLDYENLCVVDFVCHGVPSPAVFVKYRVWLEKQLGNRLDSYFFRDKHWSWMSFNIKAIAGDKTYYGTWQEDPWMRGFLREYFLRPCCHRCQFANLNRVSDITMADYWGYRSRPELPADDLGMSMVIINTPRAVAVFEQVTPLLKYASTELSEAVRGNKALSSAFPASPMRDEFWSDFRAMSFSDLVTKYMYPERIRVELRVLYRFGAQSPLYRLALKCRPLIFFMARARVSIALRICCLLGIEKEMPSK